MPRLSPITRSALAYHGLQVFSLYQPQHLFADDGRKLKRCPQAGDPWQATLFDTPSYLTCTATRSGRGATPDEAVMAALDGWIDRKGPLTRLGEAMDGLIMAMRLDGRQQSAH